MAGVLGTKGTTATLKSITSGDAKYQDQARKNFYQPMASPNVNIDPTKVVGSSGGWDYNAAGDRVRKTPATVTAQKTGDTTSGSTQTSLTNNQNTPDPAIAKTAAELSQLASEIRDRISGIKSTYDSIFGTAQQAAGEQNSDLDAGYGKTVDTINTQLGQDLSTIGAAHAANGTYDSSYRGNNQDIQKGAANQQISQAGEELRGNKATIGSEINKLETGYNAEKSGLDRILGHIAESTNPDELRQLRATLDSKLTEIEAGRSDVASTKQNLAKLTNTTSEATRIQALKGTLASIIGGNASPSLKKSVATQFITSAGLSDDAQNKLLTELNGALAQTPTA